MPPHAEAGPYWVFNGAKLARSVMELELQSEYDKEDPAQGLVKAELEQRHS